MRTFVVGDIHGENTKLLEVLKSVDFDNENDRLISLGDLTDRGRENWEVLETIRKIKNKILIRGNHDEQLYYYLKNRKHDSWWKLHGGIQTIVSYTSIDFMNQEEHIELLKSQVNYHVENNICFVHGGFDENHPINIQSISTLLWDRNLIEKVAYSKKNEKIKTFDNFDKIFLGHTPVQYFGEELPMNKCGVINLDTGAGKGGKITLWNLETNEYIQST